jgi:hypothetical protein
MARSTSSYIAYERGFVQRRVLEPLHDHSLCRRVQNLSRNYVITLALFVGGTVAGDSPSVSFTTSPVEIGGIGHAWGVSGAGVASRREARCQGPAFVRCADASGTYGSGGLCERRQNVLGELLLAKCGTVASQRRWGGVGEEGWGWVRGAGAQRGCGLVTHERVGPGDLTPVYHHPRTTLTQITNSLTLSEGPEKS